MNNFNPSKLSSESIFRHLSPAAQAKLSNLSIFDELESTNDYLLSKAQQGLQPAAVCLAESQSAGRGRQGKTWHSPAGNLYFSLLWHFDHPQQLMGLSLVVGLAVVHALACLGLDKALLGLKWPNDVYWKNRKLSGVLIETRKLDNGKIAAVIGVGINVALPDAVKANIDQPAIDLLTIQQGFPGRNQLVALLIEELFAALDRFMMAGFEVFKTAWQHYDVTYAQRICLLSQGQRESGVGRGVNAHGQLLFERTSGEVQAIFSGDISLRLVE